MVIMIQPRGMLVSKNLYLAFGETWDCHPDPPRNVTMQVHVVLIVRSIYTMVVQFEKPSKGDSSEDSEEDWI